MDALELLELAKGEEHGPEGGIQDAGVLMRLAGHGKRRGPKQRKQPERKWKRGIMGKQVRAHMIRFNSQGMARTQDYVMYDPSQSMAIPGRAKVRGKGAWKTWTLESVCRSAFAAPDRSTRSVIDGHGGSPASAMACRFVVARRLVLRHSWHLAGVDGHQRHCHADPLQTLQV